jgi:hypothetical protein
MTDPSLSVESQTMNIQDLGSIGELVAAIATVATLAYLAIQIRQNTRSTRAAMIQASYSQSFSFTSLLGSDTQIARVWRIGLFTPSGLNPDEYVQFLGLATAMLRNFENVFIQFRDSAEDPEAWEPWDLSLRDIMRAPGLRACWNERKGVFANRFRAYVDSIRAS